MSLLDWIKGLTVSENVIDLYFIQSDLKDINLTESERCESACFDALASNTEQPNDDARSIGKLVL